MYTCHLMRAAILNIRFDMAVSEVHLIMTETPERFTKVETLVSNIILQTTS